MKNISHNRFLLLSLSLFFVVVPHAPASIVTTTSYDALDGMHTYSYELIHDDTDKAQTYINQWVIPLFNDPDELFVSGSFVTPNNWTYTYLSSPINSWNYESSTDLNAGTYGISSMELEMPSYGLQFSIDQENKDKAQTDLNSALTAQSEAQQAYNSKLDDVDHLKKSISSTGAEIYNLEKQYNDLLAELKNLDDEIKLIQNTISGTSDPEELTALLSQLAALSLEYQLLNQQAFTIKNTLDEKISLKAILEVQLAEAQTSLGTLQAQLDDANIHVAQSQTYLESASGLPFGESLLFEFKSAFGKIDLPAQITSSDDIAMASYERVHAPYFEATSVPEPSGYSLFILGACLLVTNLFRNSYLKR